MCRPSRASVRSSPQKRGPSSAQELDSRLRGNERICGAGWPFVKGRLASLRVRYAGAPHIDAGEQEQPHDVNEVPVPGGELEAEMLRRTKLALQRADQAHDQEDRTDDDMRAVKAGRHEEGGAVDIAFEAERRVRVLVSLHA